MDWMEWLLSQGFGVAGTGMGLAIADGILTLTCRMDVPAPLPLDAVTASLTKRFQMQVIDAAHTRDGYWQVALAIGTPPDVFVVGDDKGLVDEEVQRWTGRGYRAVRWPQQAARPEGGLVVEIGRGGRSYSGRLPRYPQSALCVGGWH
jgi:hypothetical protein